MTRAVVAGTVVGVATLVQMGVLAWIVHQAVIEGSSLSAVSIWLVPLVSAILVRGYAQGRQGHYAARASHTIRAQVRHGLLANWAQRGPVQLKQDSPAELASEWLDQVEALHGYYAHFLPQMMLCVIVPLIVLVVVGTMDWLAALLLFLSAPLIPLFMALVGMGAEKLNQQHFEMIGWLSGQFLDKIRGLTTLQLFDAGDHAARSLERSSDQYRKITMKTLKVAFLSSAVLEFFSSVAIAVVAMYIGFGLLGYISFGPADQLSLFSGLFILMLAPEFFQPLRQLAQHYHDRAAALGAAELLIRRLEDTAEPKPSGHPSPAATSPDHPDRVLLESVSVRYQPDQPILTDVSLTLNKGQCLALTGPSGGGKTTLLNLMAGFLAPDSGSLSVFSTKPGSMPFGWLGQSPFLLHGSWADNLRLVAPNASDKDVTQALHAVGLDRLLAQRQDGINSLVTEQGKGLSGGQARRLALARIFVADFELILLDEPTAGLDATNQQFLVNALGQLKLKGKTLVIATHHPSLLTLADQVMTVENGRIRNG